MSVSANEKYTVCIIQRENLYLSNAVFVEFSDRCDFRTIPYLIFEAGNLRHHHIARLRTRDHLPHEVLVQLKYTHSVEGPVS